MRPSLRVLFFSFIFFFSFDAYAQRSITYQELAFRHTSPAIFYDMTFLPGNQDNALIHFRFAHHALNFRTMTAVDRVSSAPNDAQFFSELDFFIEIERVNRNSNDPIIISRFNWSGVAYASNYEETQSSTASKEGSIRLTLEPGTYVHRVILQSDGKNVRFSSNERRFTVPDFSTGDASFIQFIDEESPTRIRLTNYGRTALFGQDATLLIYLPSFDENATYTVHIDEVTPRATDTSFVANVFSREISNEQIRRFSSASFSGVTTLDLVLNDDGEHTFAVVDIPKRRFRNAHFQVYVTKNNAPHFVHRYFRSLWIDIPISLLNLDVAISMMQYIVDQETFRELRRGSNAERERKFRAFWSERDHEPDIEFNPLMVEFYRRVDIAYSRFSSPGTPGFSSERGRIFLRNGEPLEISRTFPAGRPAQEVWRYADRTFIFEATTGFGDFVLVRQVRS